MKRWDKIDINTINYRSLIYSLYLTQLLMLLISCIIFVLFFKESFNELVLLIIPKNLLFDCVIAILFTSLIVLINIGLTKFIPKKYLDDGGINEKLFINTPVWHIAIISLIVSFTEELLFRLFIQSFLGIVITSIIFTLIHFRYFDKIILLSFTFLTSIFLGYLLIYTEWFTVFLAHALIDFTLGVAIRKKLITY